MRRINYLLPLLIIVIITAAALVWQAGPAPEQPAPAAAVKNDLQVSSEGGRMNTDVETGSLQPAAPPAGSATSAETNPQPAVPNYCQPGEQPVIDGCVAPSP